MTAYGFLQALVLTLVIGGSVAFALRQYFPKGLRLRFGGWLQKPQHPLWMRIAGAWLVPAARQGCDSGCASCGGCGSGEKTSDTEQPLVFATGKSRQKPRAGSI
ncbi:MAG: DUF6587 family protein [Stenotrophobium sp.]